MEEKIYPTYKIAKLFAILREQDIDTDAFLKGTSLTSDDISSNSTRISRRQLNTAYENAFALSKDPAIGLIVGQRLGLTDYGIYGYGLVSSATLRRALNFSIKYHQIATPTVRMSLLVDDTGDTASFRMEDMLENEKIYQFNLEIQFGLVFSLFKDMVGRSFRFKEIYVSYPSPPHHDVYREIFECPVVFDQPNNDLRFDSELLDKPLVRANPITAATTRELCDQILLEMIVHDGIAHEVYSIITEDLREFSNIDAVARSLNMSSRTLRRRLAGQETSFLRILNEIRRQLAIEFLRNTTISSEEIADRLGFSDATNFRHAFKKWTGKTISDFR